ncbi:MAG: hypothetical protein SFW35_07230 [Chitinophagales bacterium]|nr:hypothetical protein [Chitinophagales bacterium]
MAVRAFDIDHWISVERKNRKWAVVAAILAHAFLLLLLLFLVLPMSGGGGGGEGGDGGIPVDFGTTEFGSGAVQPETAELIPVQLEQTPPPVTPSQPTDDQLLTSDDPESIELPTQPKPNTQPKPVTTNTNTKPTTSTTTQPSPQQPKPQVNQQALMGKPTGKNVPGSQGDDPGNVAGDKGKPNGTQGQYTGPGGTGPGGTGTGTGGGNGDGDGTGNGSGKGPGSGPGYSINLKNRKPINSLVVQGNIQESGVIVIRITVDRNGKVINSECCTERGSTLSHNAAAVATAKSEAYKLKFNADPSAPAEQFGTVTFKFVTK